MMRTQWGLASSTRCRKVASALSGLSKSCEMTTAAPRAPMCDQSRYLGRRRGDDGEIGGQQQVGDRTVRQYALHRRVAGVHRHHRAVEPAPEQIRRQHPTDRTRRAGGAEQRDRAGPEQELEIGDSPIKARHRRRCVPDPGIPSRPPEGSSAVRGRAGSELTGRDGNGIDPEERQAVAGLVRQNEQRRTVGALLRRDEQDALDTQITDIGAG